MKPHEKCTGRLHTVLAAAALVACGCQANLSAQDAASGKEVVAAPELRKSPMRVAAITMDDGTYMKVVYSSPNRRGRHIFGGLVPYDKIWRTGANEATEITFTGDVAFGPDALAAGTYSLFTVPGEEDWTIVVNNGLGQWGAYDYNQSLDVVRFNVPVGESENIHESFTIEFRDDEGTSLVLLWDHVRVAVPVSPR